MECTFLMLYFGTVEKSFVLYFALAKWSTQDELRIFGWRLESQEAGNDMVITPS